MSNGDESNSENKMTPDRKQEFDNNIEFATYGSQGNTNPSVITEDERTRRQESVSEASRSTPPPNPPIGNISSEPFDVKGRPKGETLRRSRKINFSS